MRPMAAEAYTALLSAYQPWDELETRHWEVHSECWAVRAIGADRPCRHLTASAYVVHPDGERVLVHWHARLGRWLQPGGHLEPGETPISACVREVAEEVGLEFEPPEAIFDLDVHHVPATARMPAHDHVDARFLLLAPSDALPPSPEGAILRWLTWEELVASDPSDSGFPRIAAKARQILAARRKGRPGD